MVFSVANLLALVSASKGRTSDRLITELRRSGGRPAYTISAIVAGQHGAAMGISALASGGCG
jgi:hypothetical protein